ncbi:hypothetical protein JW979_15740 [bacterium]|nr:hypothetical protein [candidate division CSSED10-310 bacterium]
MNRKCCFKDVVFGMMIWTLIMIPGIYAAGNPDMSDMTHSGTRSGSSVIMRDTNQLTMSPDIHASDVNINGKNPGGVLIDFDDLNNADPIGSHYPGVVFSEGWLVWSSGGHPSYPPHSPPNVAYTHSLVNYINWSCDVNVICFYACCYNDVPSSWTFSVFDDVGDLLQQIEITDSVVNESIVFPVHGIRRLEVAGTGEWNTHYTIDDLYYECVEYLQCPPDSILSQPFDVTHPYANGFTSDTDSAYRTADGYTISSGETIRSVRWWGFSVTDPQQDFTIGFYPDDSGKPGSTGNVHTVTASYIDTGYEYVGNTLYQFDAVLPSAETLTHGWIVIESLSDPAIFYWANSTMGDNLAMQYHNSAWSTLMDNLAFCLSPTGVPPCTETGCTVYMPSTNFGVGDDCYCDVYVCNADSTTYTDIPLFVILDVYGAYFFAPSFGSYDYYDDPIPPGMTTIPVLPSFPWPSGAGSASNITWFAAMTNPGFTALHGNLGTFTFGWH